MWIITCSLGCDKCNNNNNNNNDLITAYLQGSSTSANLINITILLKYLLIIFRVRNVR